MSHLYATDTRHGRYGENVIRVNRIFENAKRFSEHFFRGLTDKKSKTDIYFWFLISVIIFCVDNFRFSAFS